MVLLVIMLLRTVTISQANRMPVLLTVNMAAQLRLPLPTVSKADLNNRTIRPLTTINSRVKAKIANTQTKDSTTNTHPLSKVLLSPAPVLKAHMKCMLQTPHPTLLHNRMVLNHLLILRVASIPVNRLTINLLPIVMANRPIPTTDHQLVRAMGLLAAKGMDSQDLRVMDSPHSKAMDHRVTKAMRSSTQRVMDKEMLLIMVVQAVPAVRTMDRGTIRITDNQAVKDTANRHHSNCMERMAILATSTAAIRHLQRLLGRLEFFAFTRFFGGPVQS